MKISLEWIMEIVTGAVLFGIIFLSMYMEAVPAGSGAMEAYEEVEQNAVGPGNAGGGSVKEQDGEGQEEYDYSKQKAWTQEDMARRLQDGEHLIRDFKVIRQEPELPTGCEITSLTMVLNYYGLDVDKVTMAEKYLPTVPAEFYFDQNGDLYGADLERYFVGDPATEKGYICGSEAIKAAADRYLSSIHSTLRAEDKTGASLCEVYQWVSEDRPVAVWVTIDMEERTVIEGWYTESGGYVEWGSNDHGAVLIGYTPDKVIVADPIAGKAVYSRESFEEVFRSRGNKCIIVK